MAPFTDDFVTGLVPRAEKFDEFENDEFGVRVFPNGTKTWIFSYEVNGYRRFKTIGIFPAMSCDAARNALEMNRRIAEIDDGVTIRQEDTLRFRKPDFSEKPTSESQTKGSARRILPWVAVGMATLLGAAAIAYVYLPGALNKSIDAPLPTENLSVRIAEKPASDSKAKPEQTAPAEKKDDSPKVEDEIRLPDEKKRKPLLAGADTSTPAMEPALETLALNSNSTSEISNTQADIPLPETKAQADAIVPRAQFTSAIVDLEPVDRIGPTIIAPDSGIDVFFFTDIRHAGGQEITHVWEHDGREIARIPFAVDSNWRWRVNSRKRVLSTQTGIWRVTVYDQKGMPIKADGFIVEAGVPEPVIAAEITGEPGNTPEDE